MPSIAMSEGDRYTIVRARSFAFWRSRCCCAPPYILSPNQVADPGSEVGTTALLGRREWVWAQRAPLVNICQLRSLAAGALVMGPFE